MSKIDMVLLDLSKVDTAIYTEVKTKCYRSIKTLRTLNGSGPFKVIASIGGLLEALKEDTKVHFFIDFISIGRECELITTSSNSALRKLDRYVASVARHLRSTGSTAVVIPHAKNNRILINSSSILEWAGIMNSRGTINVLTFKITKHRIISRRNKLVMFDCKIRNGNDRK